MSAPIIRHEPPPGAVCAALGGCIGTDEGGDVISEPYVVAVLEADPTPAEWRGRCLLALSLVSHRATIDGLSASDASAIRAVLDGSWAK